MVQTQTSRRVARCILWSGNICDDTFRDNAVRFGGLPQQPPRQPVKYLAEITLVVDRRGGYKLYKYRFNVDCSFLRLHHYHIVEY